MSIHCHPDISAAGEVFRRFEPVFRRYRRIDGSPESCF